MLNENFDDCKYIYIVDKNPIFLKKTKTKIMII